MLDHIVLTGYSKMKFAVQVLSRTVSTCVFESGDPEVVGTAIFCQMINAFFYCTNVYGQEQNISSRRTNPSPIPLLMTSSLYGCRKPSWPTWRTGKPVLLEEREISVQLPKAICSCHTRPMKASRSLSTPTWSNQIPPFCTVWICVYRKVHARCDWGLLWAPKDPERKIR